MAAVIMGISVVVGEPGRAVMMLAPLLGSLAFALPLMAMGRARPYPLKIFVDSPSYREPVVADHLGTES